MWQNKNLPLDEKKTEREDQIAFLQNELNSIKNMLLLGPIFKDVLAKSAQKIWANPHLFSKIYLLKEALSIDELKDYFDIKDITDLCAVLVHAYAYFYPDQVNVKAAESYIEQKIKNRPQFETRLGQAKQLNQIYQCYYFQK